MKNLLVLVFLVCAMTAPSAAQNTSLPEAIGRAKKAHNDCVANSVAAQLSAIAPKLRRQADINMMTEMGFQACATEEQVMAALGGSLPRDQLNAALIGNRVALKRLLNDVFVNPQNYIR